MNLDPSMARSTLPLLPWENSYFDMIFKGKHLDSQLFDRADVMFADEWDPRFLASAARASSSADAGTGPEPEAPESTTYKVAAAAVKARSKATTLDSLRDVELERWRLLLFTDLSASITGKQILEAVKFSNSENRIRNTLVDTFESKSTATLGKRIGSMLMFQRWHACSYSSVKFLPITEEMLYACLCDWRIERVPASKANGLREAIAFCHGLLGLQDCEAAMKSVRCQGVALSSELV